MIFFVSPAKAVTITTNTYVAPGDSTYDSQDIEVTNCTVTIDGPHTFLSLHIQNGGIVTHSFSSNGVLLTPIHISGEPQVMSDTNPPTLNHPNVVAATVVLSDTNLITYYTQTVDFVVTQLVSGFSQLLRTTNSSIPDGATVLAAYDASDSVPAGLSLTISNNIEIEIGGAINVNGVGYGPAFGQGAGRSVFTNSPYAFFAGSGGGHGGYGGSSSTAAAGGNAYGSIVSPATLGSGGGAGTGSGGAGGGLVNLWVGALLRVDGQIAANGFAGTNAHSGGGAGGGLLLAAQGFSGSGTVTANGGAGEPLDGGGGGGGHIAIHSATNLFAGVISAHGGAGATAGGAGTIYVTNDTTYVSQVLVDNGRLRGTNTLLTVSGAYDLIVTNGAIAQLSGPFALSSLLVASNSFLTHTPGGPALTLTILTNATISAGGGITADAKGFGGGTGPGAGGLFVSPFGLVGGGAGYGGYGGATYTNAGGGNYYGTGNTPAELGSGGGPGTGFGSNGRGGTGGGAIRLIVTGRLTLDGTITANGANGLFQGTGGGSGGSVWLDAGTFAGAGAVSANGGSGEVPLGGGGAGGRIAIRYFTNQFTGLISAYGGAGAHAGGAGTIYTTTNGAAVGQVIVDNHGLRGTNTPLPFSGVALDLTSTGGAIIDLKPVQQPQIPTIHNLVIRSNGWVTAGSASSQILSLSIIGDAIVESGGGLLFDGLGYPAGQGQGGGQSLSSPFPSGGGGGHGGYGGSSAFGALGGNYFISSGAAIEAGSGGGSGSGTSTNNLGGAGGGALQLLVSGILRLDGIITANGRPGVGQWSGGGSGGGIYISANTFLGQGTISADGGAGDAPYGGGGGGGRVIISAAGSNAFTGVITARGASGWMYGGAGTTYWNSSRDQNPRLLIDNGGFQGTNTPVSVLGVSADVTITGRAVAVGVNLPTIINLLIASNSWLTFTSPFEPRSITVTSNVTVQAGGGINMDGLGRSQVGAGSFSTGGGGGYGGFGGNGTNAGGGGVYGSVSSPIDLGSIGGYGTGNAQTNPANGGGALHLVVGGTLALDGAITANGITAQGTGAGGGSGGSLWIAISRLMGTGAISAIGGSGDLPLGGGGGGGRIALFYATNQFAGTISARAGAGANYGGAGTIFLQASNAVNTPFQYPRLVIDNGGIRGTNTPISVTANQFDLTVTGGGQGTIGLTIPPIGTLLIGANSSLAYTSPYSPRNLTVQSNATIQAGGSFALDGQGSARGTGPGAGASSGFWGGGGGYGGYGGSSAINTAGGNAYGSIVSPIDMGSGGGGFGNLPSALSGAGGGALHLTVNGTLTVDGTLTANGMAAFAQANGGGAGGSLWLSGGKLSGAGLISANGGSGDLPAGGGGGGGRISISFNTNQFAGSLAARGGPGAAVGGAGTIYITPTKGLPGSALLLVDNGGARGTNTPLSFSGLQDFDLTLGPGASAIASNQILCRNLLISSNSFLISSRAILNISSNATIQSGGGIVLDGLASGGAGPGRTTNSSFGNSGGGGGYAGYGGSSGLGAAGGTSYGSFSNPTDVGSGGGNGNGSSTNSFGGAGGGALQLTVTRTLTCDGTLSANGTPGIGQWSGGGSGGSIWVSAGTLVGAGLITANGGAGDPPYGGGGGGGRIAIYFNTNQFAGSTAAHGGSGATAGGAGTIYVKTNTGPNIQITIDNGGLSGTNTPIQVVGNVDMTVRGGAIAQAQSGTFIRNALIESNSWIAALRDVNGGWQMSVSNNFIIKPTGGLTANGRGFAGNSGPGFGATSNTQSNGYTGAGGGYGGYGGQSIDGAAGGNSYGSISQPVDAGSGGGGLPTFGYGGAGGGIIRLTVSNNLVVDGRISADGLDGVTEGAGGGSGGSVLLSSGTLSGAGLISANGGNGDYFQGGGGGGGRIAVYYGNSSFTGAFTAYGGYGAVVGGAGTIYGKANPSAIGQLLIDNGGPAGTNTPIGALGTSDLSVLGGALATLQVPLTLNSLFVDSGGTLTHPPLGNPLDLLVFGNGVIGTNGAIVVNGKGYTGSNPGPGAGRMLPGGAGSGGGYGVVGGTSASGTPGGTNYGSATQPTDFGSSGGYDLAGSGNRSLSQGGGAARLRVAGALTLNGKIAANGADGTYDRSGGGAGGSIWLTARSLDGQGFITANGGSGELFDGGGGAGGRIAIYTRTNTLSGPIVAFGGYGYSFGGSGTVIITNIPPPSIISQIPSGIVSYTVSNVDITFGSPMNFSTASTSDVIVYTPVGGMPDSDITVSPLNPNTLRFSFPAQNTVGYYEIDVGPDIQDIYGLSMADTYIGSFVIASPIISGHVFATNGTPVSFVTLRAGSGLQPVVTDSNGQYSLEVPPGWSGTVTPSKGSSIFIPASRSYVNVSADATNQNFISTTSTALALHSQKQGNNLNVSWFGINGVTYQTLHSTNFIDWLPYGAPFVGTNGTINLQIPLGTARADFFRFSSSY